MLDEPSRGIMPRLVDEIFAAVEVIRRAGTTVLIVEQRLTECLEIADRAYVMRTGQVLMSGMAPRSGTTWSCGRHIWGCECKAARGQAARSNTWSLLRSRARTGSPERSGKRHVLIRLY
jgi:ABC-type uncharacterized transport system ATPase subunit